MQYVKLGNTDIEISKICIGCMGFGKVFPEFHAWVVDQPATQAVIKRAIELGINFFDTANAYSKGTSEEFIGESIKNLGIARDKVVIASKVFFNPGGLSKEAINREIDGTLKRLGTEYLDLYYIHRFDYDVPIEETMEALDGLVRSGKVRAIGASEMYAYQLHNMQIRAEHNGWTKFSVLQPHYNLIYREDEREMLPLARQYDMTIVPYSSLAAGHLTRPIWEGTTKRAETDKVAKDKYDAAKENNMQIITRVSEIAAKHDVPMADVALAWLWKKGIDSPIVGCTKPERVDDVAKAIDLKLAAEDIAYLEEPYAAHELVGPAGRPGEKAPAGIMKRAGAEKEEGIPLEKHYLGKTYVPIKLSFDIPEDLQDEIDEFLECLNCGNGKLRDCYESEIRSSLNGYNHILSEEQDRILRDYYCKGGVYRA